MKRNGFTLIEMMVTVAIIAVLASVIVPLAELSVQRSKEQELRHALREVRAALDAYKHAVDEGRIRHVAGESGYPPDLHTLVEGVRDISSPAGHKIYFLRRVPRDPFSPDAAVNAESTWGKRSYRSEPDHPKEGRDVYDIYSRSDRVGLNGVPYRDW